MVSKSLFSSASDEWGTPQVFFDELNERFDFTLDPCATDENHKGKKYFTAKENGLLQSWQGHRVFCNPPYSEIKLWVEKSVKEKAFTVLLIPARTDTRWFHEFIYRKDYATILFIKGRLKFGNSKNSAPFPSMIVEIFGGNYDGAWGK
jgi:phage N-6-adenine-methyltransferase